MKTLREAIVEHLRDELTKAPTKRVFTIERGVVEVILAELGETPATPVKNIPQFTDKSQ